jgi:hypothetical protein
MKHIVKFNENFEHESHLGPVANQQSSVNRSKILAEIESAEREDDWQRVKELTQMLQVTSESVLIGWSDYELLLENVQEGKTFLQRLADSEVEKTLSREVDPNLTPEQTEEIKKAIQSRVNAKYFGPDSDFEKIKKILHKNPKYVGPFTLFRYAQNADISTLENLYKTLVDLKDSLDQLPMTLDEYSKLQYSKTTHPGWEMLGDELNKLLEIRKGNWIVKALPKESMTDLIARGLWQGQPVDLREEYKRAPREKQVELLKAAADLEDLNKPNFKELIRRGLSGKPSLDAIIDIIKSTVANANTERGEILERAVSAYPSVAVLYSGENHYVFSFRNDSQLPHLCAKARGWCIQPAWYNPGYADRFWSYALGSLQLGILDFTVDPSSPFHTVGVTIKPNRSVTSLCDQPNNCTSGSDFRQLFKSFQTANGTHSYPQELIDAIDENFDAEVKLKSQSDDVYQKLKKYSEGERDQRQVLVKTIQGLIRDITSFSQQGAGADSAKVNSEKNIVNQILATELKNLRSSPELLSAQQNMIGEYVDGQKILPTPADVKMFEIFFEESPLLTFDKINRMVTKTNQMNAVLDAKIKTIPPGTETPTSRKVKNIAESLSNAIVALKALGEKIKK